MLGWCVRGQCTFCHVGELFSEGQGHLPGKALGQVEGWLGTWSSHSAQGLARSFVYILWHVHCVCGLFVLGINT